MQRGDDAMEFSPGAYESSASWQRRCQQRDTAPFGAVFYWPASSRNSRGISSSVQLSFSSSQVI